MGKCLLHSVFWSVLSRPSFSSWIFNTARRTKRNEKEEKWTLPLSTTRKITVSLKLSQIIKISIFSPI